MPKNIGIALMVAAALAAAGYGWWKQSKSKAKADKQAEISLDGTITEDDKKAKPSKHQCERYVDDEIARMDPSTRDAARAIRGTRVEECEAKFTIAALKCMRDGEASGKVLSSMLDPYGCVTANPRK